MKALIFNHHPDNTWQIYATLQQCNVDAYIATHDLTLQCGADFSSSSQDFKLRRGPLWFEEEELLGSKCFKYADTLEGIDYVFSMHRDIVKNINFNPIKTFFNACITEDLEGLNDFSKYVKITSHANAAKYGAKYVPYFVQQRGKLVKREYITQLIERYDSSPYYKQLVQLKNKLPVIIAGSHAAPDGIVDDWNALTHTALLVHHKSYGTNCNAVMKALDCGIPIYISRQNKSHIGMDDLPDEMFLFSDDMSILEAYEKSLLADNTLIQKTFRLLRNIEVAADHLKKIL
jgi:hypothetical protein